MHPSLDPDALLAAYARGWFPMDEPGASGPVGLYEADPRGLMPTKTSRVPVGRPRHAAGGGYEIRLDAAFPQVAAFAVRPREPTKLTPRLVGAYERLHGLGVAHSVEAGAGGASAAGLSGSRSGALHLGVGVHRAPDAGNAALVATAGMLRAAGFELWDIQMTSPHTPRFGAETSPRAVPPPPASGARVPPSP